ncbi:MAG: hypothetical protein IPJ56_09020 [Gemmatimonadetes bacterium]|nr:hypothetical protein [Gemmatimonadota bacterium]
MAAMSSFTTDAARGVQTSALIAALVGFCATAARKTGRPRLRRAVAERCMV